MQSKDIVLQVSEETAEVMKEISEQLFDESDTRFDEVKESIKDVKEKVDSLHDKFTSYTGDSNKEVMSNQKQLMDEFAKVLNEIEVLREFVSKLQTNVKEKLDSDDSKEKLTFTINKLSVIEKKTLQTQETVDELGKQNEGSYKLLLEKMDNVFTCFDTLSYDVHTISEKQNKLCDKQKEFDRDIKYLKLPFFKRWFTKG